MMNILKKLAACGLSLTMVLSLAACGGSTDDTASNNDTSADGGETVKYLIGISQYGQHGSLDNCREGFLQGLEQAGLVEGTDFEVDYQNANFDDNQATQIGQMFSAEDVDLMVGIATNAATACFNAAEDKDCLLYTSPCSPPCGAERTVSCRPALSAWRAPGSCPFGTIPCSRNIFQFFCIKSPLTLSV